jgi:hypothetical protein
VRRVPAEPNRFGGDLTTPLGAFTAEPAVTDIRPQGGAVVDRAFDDVLRDLSPNP